MQKFVLIYSRFLKEYNKTAKIKSIQNKSLSASLSWIFYRTGQIEDKMMLFQYFRELVLLFFHSPELRSLKVLVSNHQLLLFSLNWYPQHI